MKVSGVPGVPARARVTTTHDPAGGGMPRLFFAHDVHRRREDQPAAINLLPGVTVIGSNPQAHLQLADVSHHHAEIRRDDADEYHYIHLGSGPASMVNGVVIRNKVLHTGDRIQIGRSSLSFYRDEFADHGRPHGGRLGGQRRQPPQDRPRSRGTSPDGGRHRDLANPGEYF